MRLLQLTLDPERDAVLELHGAMTVVTGMSDRERERLVRIVTAVAKGEDPGMPGLVEAHGVVLDLTSEVLALLDTGADVDPLVRRRDLPGAVPTLPGDEVVDDPSAATVDPAELVLSSTPTGVDPELDRVRRRLHDAVQTREVLEEAAARAARDLDAAGRDRRRAVERLDAANQRAAEPLGPEHRTGPAGVEVAELEAAIAHIEAGVAELEGLDIRPIAVLLDAIENPGPVEEVPSPRAQALADRFVALQAQVAVLEERLEAEGRGPVSAMRRLDEARAEVTAAERMRDRAEVTPDDEAELRRAHERVLEAERKASGLRSRSGQRKLADALARQQEILDRLGYPTWSAFIMGASLMGADPAGEERLSAAQAELEAAEAHWVEISSALEADPDHHALLDELEQVELDAVGLLLERGIGVPDERNGLEETLRALREPKHEVDPAELVDALAFHLTSIGMDLGDQATDAGHVRRVARAFLDEAAGIRERIDELGVERRRLEARLADARSRSEAEAWAALEASVEVADAGGATLAELEEALAEARRGEDELVEVLEAREALLETAVHTEQQAREQALAVARSRRSAPVAPEFDASEGSPDAGLVRPGWSEIDPEAIEFYLLARLAAQRQVSYSGSVPALVDDALAGIPEESVHRVLDGLGRMAAAVQVVYLTDDPSVLAWARANPDTAAVVAWSSAVAETPV